MIVLGLTGSIGMGKSTIVDMLRKMEIAVHEADQETHSLLGPNGKAVSQVAQNFSEDDIYLKDNNEIDRGALGNIVFTNSEALSILEDILHPFIQDAQKSFILAARHEGFDLAVLDIPLLFETQAEYDLDYTMVASAPYSVQEQRVLARPGMTREKFHAILERQMPDQMKCALADYIIPTGISRSHTEKELQKVIKEIRSQ